MTPPCPAITSPPTAWASVSCGAPPNASTEQHPLATSAPLCPFATPPSNIWLAISCGAPSNASPARRVGISVGGPCPTCHRHTPCPRTRPPTPSATVTTPLNKRPTQYIRLFRHSLPLFLPIPVMSSDMTGSTGGSPSPRILLQDIN